MEFLCNPIEDICAFCGNEWCIFSKLYDYFHFLFRPLGIELSISSVGVMYSSKKLLWVPVQHPPLALGILCSLPFTFRVELCFGLCFSALSSDSGVNILSSQELLFIRLKWEVDIKSTSILHFSQRDRLEEKKRQSPSLMYTGLLVARGTAPIGKCCSGLPHLNKFSGQEYREFPQDDLQS